jgi:hypothetical protein
MIGKAPLKRSKKEENHGDTENTEENQQRER